MSTIAVFVVLGGGAYAAVKAKKNSVVSSSVKDESLTGDDVKNDTLTDADILESTLDGLQGPQGPQGPVGPQGQQGQQGQQGEQGVPGPTSAGLRNTSDPDVPPDSINPFGAAQVNAPTSGKILAFFSGEVTVTCTSGNPDFGLYLDGSSTPVPDTKHSLTSGVPEQFTVFGLTGTVAPGTRALPVGFNCPSGNISGSPTGVDMSTGGIFIGG